MLALLYNFTSAYTNISSCRRDESKTSFTPTRVSTCISTSNFSIKKTCIMTNKTITFLFIHQIFKSVISSTFDMVLSKLMNNIDQRKCDKAKLYNINM